MSDTTSADGLLIAEQHLRDTGFPPPLTFPLWSHDFLASFALTLAEEVVDRIPPHNPDRPAHRAAIANLLHHVRQWNIVISMPGGPSARETLLRDMQVYLRRDRSSFVQLSVSQLRWELHAAACAADLAAVLDIASGWATVDQSSVYAGEVVEILCGLSTSLPNDVSKWTATFCTFQESTDDDDEVMSRIREALAFTAILGHLDQLRVTMNRDPDICEAFISGEMLDSALAVAVDDDPERLTQLLQRVPNVCRTLLDSMAPEDLTLQPFVRAIHGWALTGIAVDPVDLERYADAGREFATVAQTPDMLGAMQCAVMHAAAAKCFGWATRFVDAERHARSWVATIPSSAEARKALAEYLYKQGRDTEAIEAFEQYVSRKDESTDEDWSASLLLKLGLEAVSNRQLSASIESAAYGSPFRPQGEAILHWMAPWVRDLVEPAADKWWAGYFLLTDATARHNLGESILRQIAGAAFGEAVKFQLQECVSRPFSKTLPSGVSMDTYWTKFTKGTATLGEHLSCLLQARHPTHTPGKLLRGWLEKNTPQLMLHLQKQGTGLMALAKLRGDAAHADIGETELRTLYELASSVLRTVPCRRATQE